MERRNFLKLTLGLAAATAAGTAIRPSEAMPVAPVDPPRSDPELTPELGVANQDDIDVAKAEPTGWRWRRRRRHHRWWYWRRRRRRRRYWY
jgi:hypothetical protein